MKVGCESHGVVGLFRWIWSNKVWLFLGLGNCITGNVLFFFTLCVCVCRFEEVGGDR